MQPSTVNAWEKPHETAAPSILYLGPLCEALGVDANLFAVLPPIPAWEGETYLMDDEADRAAHAAVEVEVPHEPDDGDDPDEGDVPSPARERPRKTPRGR